MVAAGLLGLFFERVIVRPVYGDHLKQILITTGGMIVAEQLILVLWGPDQDPGRAPNDAARVRSWSATWRIEKYRLIAWWRSGWRCSPR